MQQRMDVGERIDQRRAHPDHARNKIRSTDRKRTREHAAAALSRDRDALSRLVRRLLEPLLEALGLALGTVDIRSDARPPRREAVTLQVARHEAEAAIRSQQPR